MKNGEKEEYECAWTETVLGEMESGFKTPLCAVEHARVLKEGQVAPGKTAVAMRSRETFK